MQISRYQLYVPMYEHELTGYDGMVWARIVRFSGDRLVVTDIEGTLQEVQDQAGDSVPYSYSVSIDAVPEDREFLARWEARYVCAWPHVGFYSMHPVLCGANKIFGKVTARWLDRNAMQRAIVQNYNRFLHDSDSDDGGI